MTAPDIINTATVSAPNGGTTKHPIVDNPTPHRLPEGENAAPLEVVGSTASDKLVIIMVGLPATGRFIIINKIYIML